MVEGEGGMRVGAVVAGCDSGAALVTAAVGTNVGLEVGSVVGGRVSLGKNL
jgi:hypothetical protein